MASVGPGGDFIVLVLHIGGAKASDIKLVLERETRAGKSFFISVSFS
jgi:hypothetical protein